VILFRKIVFYIFLLLYLVTCPLLLLYAFGFIVKPGSEYRLIKTGLIYLSTVPAGAQVHLGPSRFTQKTPVMIRDLIPGNYSVRVDLPGHLPWIQTVPVAAEKASVLDYVLLLPSKWKRELLTRDSYAGLRAIPGTEMILLQRTDKLGGLVVYDFGEDKLKRLFARDSEYAAADLQRAYTFPEGNIVILQVQMPAGPRTLAIDLGKPDKAPKDLTLFFNAAPEKLAWDSSARNYLYNYHDSVLDRINLDDGEVKPGILKNLRGMGFSDDSIYAVRNDGLVIRTDENGKDLKFLLDDPVLAQSLFGDAGFFDIEAYHDQTVLFRGEKGELLSNRLPYRQVPGGVAGFEYDKKRKRLLVWQKNKIGILDFSRERVAGGEMFEKGPRLTWIFKDGDNIAQAFWVYEGSHVLFRDGSQVRLLDTETYETPVVHTVTGVKDKTDVYYSEDSGSLYYLDKDSAQLVSLEIFPKKAVINLPFPERREEVVLKEKNSE